MLKVASFNLVAGRLQDADDTDDHWTDECLLSETNPAPRRGRGQMDQTVAAVAGPGFGLGRCPVAWL